MSYEAETLVWQLGQLGRDLQEGVEYLGELEELSTLAEGTFRKYDALYEDALARITLKSEEKSAEGRKAEARLACIPERGEMQEATIDFSRAKAMVRTQQANLSAIHKRVEIGRSLLSREKALISLAGVGEV